MSTVIAVALLNYSSCCGVSWLVHHGGKGPALHRGRLSQPSSVLNNKEERQGKTTVHRLSLFRMGRLIGIR